MPYVITPLSAADIPQFRALMAVFGEAFDERDTYLAAAPGDAYVQSLLAKPHIIALVALAGDEVVGGLVAYELEKFERARSEVYIYDLAVAEPHRRKGLATGLIHTLQRIASARGAYVIFVQAEPGDDPAIALYESLGLREDVYHFDIAVHLE